VPPVIAVTVAVAVVVITDPATMLVAALRRGGSLLDHETLSSQRIGLGAVVDPATAVTRVPVAMHVIHVATLVHDVWIGVDVQRLVLGLDEDSRLGAGMRVTSGGRKRHARNQDERNQLLTKIRIRHAI
jgi:hypothetical protein